MKLVDVPDSKSGEVRPSCRFDSGHRQIKRLPCVTSLFVYWLGVESENLKIKVFKILSVINNMVDGADRINNLNNNAYVNQTDATRIAKNKEKQLIPLIDKKQEYKLPFAIEHENPPIEFEIPKNAPQNAKEFIGALTRNKEALMKELNIDSDTYDMLAHTAIGIANTETRFGDTADRIYKAYRELYIRYERLVTTDITRPMHFSRGMTNLKYTLHADDKTQPFIKGHMLKFGIFDEYQLKSPDKSAIATIILLSNFNNRLNDKFAEGFMQSQEKYGTTRTEALCALWNGAYSKALKKGNFNPSDWTYTQKVNATMNKYKLKTN